MNGENIRKRAEEILKKRKSKDGLFIDKDIEEIIHELQVYQVELEMQNDELIKTQRELGASRNKYADLYDFAPGSYLTLDREGNIIEANLTAAKLLAASRSVLIKKPFTDYISEKSQDTFYLQFREVLRNNYSKSCELIMKKADNTIFYSQLKMTAAEDSDGNYNLIRIALTDISERKEWEDKLEHFNAILGAIRNVNQLITRERDREKLIQSACDLLIETGGYYNVWIALLDNRGKLLYYARAGFGEEFERIIENLKAGIMPVCSRKALKKDEVIIIETPHIDCSSCPLQKSYNGGSILSTKLKYNKKVYGIMTVSVASSFARNDNDHSLLVEVAGDIAFALHDIELEEERNRVKKELEKSEERFRGLTENTSDITAIINRKGAFTYISPSVKKYGYSPDEVTGRKIEDFTHRSDIYLIEERLAASIKNPGKSIPVGPFRAVHKDGKRSLIEGLFTFMPGLSGIEGVVFNGRDITGYKEIQKSLAKSEYELSIRNRIAEIFLTVEDDEIYGEVLNIILQVMESQYGYFGYIDEKGDLVCPSMTRDIWHKCSMDNKSVVFPKSSWAGLWGKALTEKKSFYSNSLLHVPAGHIPLTKAITVPVLYRGNLIGNITVANRKKDYDEKDVSLLNSLCNFIAPVLNARLERDREEKEKNRAEELLAKSEERYRKLVEFSPDLIVVHRDGKILFANESAVKHLGAENVDEILGRSVMDFVHKDYINTIEKRMKELEKYNERRNPLVEEKLINLSGEVFDVEATAVSFEYEGSPAIMVIGRDLSERKKLEKERYRLEKQLRQSQKMEAIGTLAGGIAHDFNNILGAIMGYIELSIDDLLPGTPVHYNLLHSLKATKRARDLVKQILTFSRKTHEEKVSILIDNIVKETMKFLRASLPSTINIETDIKTNSSIIIADVTQIHQVIMNLCTNAAQSMGDRGGLIKVSLEEVEIQDDFPLEEEYKSGIYVKLSVSDTGPGMTENIINRIFEPYFTTKETGKGTGLGLALVHGIVKGHGGYITVESTPGKGSRFDIFLPVANDEDEFYEEEDEKKIQRGSSEVILLVDDEEMLVEAGRENLKRLGYEVYGTAKSTKAYSLFEENPYRFDILITDQTMPDMTGLELIKKIKSIRQDIPVILCTGYSDSIDEKTAFFFGIDEFIMKPVSKEKLAEAITRIMIKEKISI